MTPHAMASAGEQTARAPRGSFSIAVLLLLMLAGLASTLEAQRPRRRRPANAEAPAVAKAPAAEEKKEQEKKEKERGLVTAYLVGRVWPGSGPAIDDAVILVREGKIVACGPRSEVEIPPFSRQIDRSEWTVTPGLVNVSSLAYQSASSWSVGNPRNNATSDIRDRLDPNHDTCEWIARSGFTTLAEGLAGGGFVGLGSLLRPVKTERHELVEVSRLVREHKAVLNAGFPVNTAGKKFFSDTLKKAKAEMERREKEAKAKPAAKKEEPKKADPKKAAAKKPEPKKEEAEKGKEKKPEPKKAEPKKADPKKAAAKKPSKPDPKLDVVISALKGELPVVLSVPGASGFLRLEGILKEYKAFKPALLAGSGGGGRRIPFFLRGRVSAGSSDFWRVADRLKEAGLPVVMSPDMGTVPGTITRLVPVRRLLDAGVAVALHPASESETGYRGFWWGLAELVRHGVDAEQVLRSVTVTPAEILGVQERYGSIEEGRMADLLFFDGDPFAPTTRLREVRVEGEVVFSEEASS